MEQPRTLNDLFLSYVAAGERDRLLTWQSPAGPVVYSTRRFVQSVLALRKYLRLCGLASQGDRIAIFSPNRPEWHVADFAILLARHVVVPVYSTLSPSQIEYLLANAGVRAAVIAGRREWELLKPLLPRLPELQWIIHMDDSLPDEDCRRHISLPELERAADPPGPIPEQLRRECAADPSDLATIVYTSGTTATPKGAMLTHGSLVFDLEECINRLDFRNARQALSVLPLAHVFERLLSYGYFRMSIPIAYGDPHDLRDLLRLHRPVVMGCVPRILEKIRDAVEQQVEALPSWKRRIARRLLQDNAGVPRPSLLDRLLALRVRRQLGGIRYFICGGAWLDPAVERFFRRALFTVLQGYGMTETSPVIALSELGKSKIGSVGRPLGRVEVRIAEDGEIQTRGAHLMTGYYNDPASTEAVLKEGWLSTGDLGRLDEEGYLYVTGRKKDMLVLSNGKKIYYSEIEKDLSRSRLIEAIFVVGEGRSYPAALIVPNTVNLERSVRERKLAFSRPDDICLPSIVDLFREEIENYQADFSNFEKVKRFCFLPQEALLDTELFTPTQKMRRRTLESKYSGWIERMYRNPEPFLIAVINRDPQY